MTTFPHVGRFQKGYDPQQVDEFLDKAHGFYEHDELPDEFDSEFIYGATFDLVRGGYSTQHVDRALERLEVAYWQRRRAEQVEESGAESWLNQVYDIAATLYPRLSRQPGERFDEPAKGKGYAKKDVDEVLDKISTYFDGNVELTAQDIRRASFPQARKSNAYDMTVVDVYLDRVISVLQAVE